MEFDNNKKAILHLQNSFFKKIKESIYFYDIPYPYTSRRNGYRPLGRYPFSLGRSANLVDISK
ncbi:hypothetical protein D3C71_1210640 [compost metagenome]